MKTFMYSQKFIDIGHSALAIDTDLPEAESLLDSLETELDLVITNGEVSPLHPDLLDEYLWATWALHISWTALRNPSWTYCTQTRTEARKKIMGKNIPGQDTEPKTA
jgi:hypothetical protein